MEITLPDIGDFKNIEIIDIHVRVGDSIAIDSPLLTLESDKATMEVPAPTAGVVEMLLVSKGDRVTQGDPLLRLAANPTDSKPKRRDAKTATAGNSSDHNSRCELLVIGAGPGGYSAAFRAADLGMETCLVERYPILGGVCLNVGCIPSKALLHVARVVLETQEMASCGVRFAAPQIDRQRLLQWKDSVIGKLTGGLSALAKKRKLRIVHGHAQFVDSHHIEVVDSAGKRQRIAFKKAIVAAGSRPQWLPGWPQDDPRIMDSTAALEMADIPQRLLVVGGGIIGLELAAVYHAIGSKITIAEWADGLLPGCDRALVKPLQKRIEKRYEAILTQQRCDFSAADKDGIRVRLSDGDDASNSREECFDRVLLAVGRKPNGDQLAAENAGLQVNEQGFFPVDKQRHSNLPHIFAIGDIAEMPMLAHKAVHEGKIAAEVAAGHKVAFEPATIPSVAYTDPEIAWTGLTSTEATAKGIPHAVATFPWAASGRALSIAAGDGLTQLIYDPESKRLLGAGISGSAAGDLIAEAVVAIEMGADIEDLALSIHAHPTLSETLGQAAEVAAGTVTDLYLGGKK